VAACQDEPRTISDVRTIRTAPVAAVTSAARFGFTGEAVADAGHASAPAYTWRLPAGWRALPATPMRAATFVVESAPEIDCSLTILPAGGGGLAANLNRWRRQMSLADLTPAELRAVPKLEVAGQEALWLESEGTYVGMGNEKPQEGAKLLGVAFEHAGSAVFVKMVGPAPAVQRERGRFEALCRSLVPAAHAAHAPEAAPDPGTAAPDAGAGATPVAWDTPPTWTRTEASSMRLVSFTLGRNRSTECYVTVLAGSGGGVAANVNRWRQQMAQPELSAPEIAALPEIPMFGTRGRMVTIRGDFTGMDGAKQGGAMMLGAVCERGGQSIFVKMIGPAADVEAERERFVAFCASLR
jgi:hypothetical protein